MKSKRKEGCKSYFNFYNLLALIALLSFGSFIIIAIRMVRIEDTVGPACEYVELSPVRKGYRCGI